MSKCSRNTKVTFLYFPKDIHWDQFGPGSTIDLTIICKVFLRCLSIVGRNRYTGVRVLIFPKKDFFGANKGFGANLAQGFAGLYLLFGCILRGVLPWWGAVGAHGVRFGAFRAVGVVRGLWALAKVKTSVRAPRLPRFILLVNFNDTLLVVSILDSLWLLFVVAFAVLKWLILPYWYRLYQGNRVELLEGIFTSQFCDFVMKETASEMM